MENFNLYASDTEIGEFLAPCLMKQKRLAFYEEEKNFEILKKKDGDLTKLPDNMKQYADAVGKAVADAIKNADIGLKDKNSMKFT